MFVVVDRSYTQHLEAGEYLRWLRDRDVSSNTQRMYASRIARFLSSCDRLSVDWRQLEWDALRGYRDQLARELLERGGQRKSSTVNAHMRCVVDFCVFAVHMGWMPPELIRQLQVRVRSPKTRPPASGYRDPMLVAQPLTSVLKLREAKSRPRTVEYEHLDQVVGAAMNARDRFLVVLLLQTGLRIGEALGLRRNDLHFLPDSRNSGCRVQGPHLHIERRVNLNGALAKSRNERAVPVTAELVDFYVDMMLEKVEVIPSGQQSDMVFVNTFREPLGEALSYDAIRYIFDAISIKVGYRVTPHVLRHTCASHWLDHGTDRDVVQELLGHAVPQSTEIYLHPRSKRLREAVERASWRAQRGDAVTPRDGSATASRLQVVREDTDVVQWRAWLREHTPDPWRPEEWDPETLVFSGDENNPLTFVKRCPDCGVLTTRKTYCEYCRRRHRRAKLRDSGIDAPEKVTRTRKQQMTFPDRDRCVITREDRLCPRVAEIKGLCHYHYYQWHKRQRKIRSGTIREPNAVAQSLKEWIEQGAPHSIPPPLDFAECLVVTCHLPAKTSRVPLCSIHHGRWERERSTKSHAEWALNADPALNANQFWLGQLPPLVIDEIIYALGVRDSRNRKLNPSVIRLAVNGLVEYGIESFATLTNAEMADMETRRLTQSYRSAVFEFARDVGEAFRSFQGVDLKSQLHWDPVEIGLSRDPSPLRGTRRRKGVDFTLIEQEWLRTATMNYCRDLTATSYLYDAHRAAVYGSEVLSKRRDRGLEPSKLGQRDADRVAKRMAEESDEDGRLLNRSYRMGNYNIFFKIVERGVHLELIEGLPTTFARSRKHVFHHSERRTRESKDAKALPDSVLRTLDANLDLLAAGRRHYLMTEPQVKAMFRTIYLLMRDTGRRPMEICALRTDCIGGTADEPVLRWYSYKMGRPGRDLPVEVALAREVQEWLSVREALSIPKASRPYLFPAVTEVSAEPYLRPPYFALTLRLWAQRIPFIGSGTVDGDGNEIEFDRSNIYPYSFRHTWAQRHADSGTQIEVLAELLDHEGLDTVGVYYRVSDKRKRSAIAKVAQHTFNHRGQPRPPVDASTYQLRALAVPYGNCTEPANVKSGGQTCPIRFQCSGCGFYRPDASHLVAIEHEVHDLRKNYEHGLAMDVEPYVLQSIEGQIASYRRIVAEMKKSIDAMSEDERKNLLEAATVMRRIRAGQLPQLKIEPATTSRTPDDDGN